MRMWPASQAVFRSPLKVVFDEVNETISRGIVGGDGCLVLQFGFNGFGQLFAKLNAEMAKSHQRVWKLTTNNKAILSVTQGVSVDLNITLGINYLLCTSSVPFL